MMAVDFTGLPERHKAYAGANGSKVSVVYEGKIYMLKFPPTPTRNKDMSYTNSCFSEYLGCQIYASIGIPVQETILGTYTVNGTDKVVVACRDFTSPGIVLQDFASLKNKILDSTSNGYGTELDDIIDAISKQTAVDSGALLERFWDMFIVDAFIANWDRHNGNWGFLYDTHNDTMELAPIFDCGSSMYPQADAAIMDNVLREKAELDFRIYEIPTSAVRSNGNKLKYFDYISSLANEDCNRALKRIVPRIKMTTIEAIVSNTPYTTELQKRFYLTMLRERKAKILDYSLNKLLQMEKSRAKETHEER